ncbi:MAG: type II secretion system protein [Candidatus Margulisiibacteriota bacterium]|nr:type II secretion system protein [Candidatus Margulisiibacteriota bacterium]
MKKNISAGRQGFTLIELLIVISIVGITLFASFPGINRFSKQLSLSGAAKAVVSEIRSIQKNALLRHETLSLNFNKISLPPGINIIKSSNIKFASSGYPPPGGSGSIILQNQNGQTKKVIISSSGRVRVE